MSKIEWTEATWNPVVGCTIISPGCTNCYAMRAAWRPSHNPMTPQYHGTAKLVNGNPVWTGKMHLVEKVLAAPLRRKKPTTYFVNSMGDLFHEDVPDNWIDQVFAVMALCPQHAFQVLTKRADRMQAYISNTKAGLCRISHIGLTPEIDDPLYQDVQDWPLHNVWLGVSIEDQRRAEERVPALLKTSAAIRFVSAEPLLGPVDLTLIRHRVPPTHIPNAHINALEGFGSNTGHTKLDWVIAGGESGPCARPSHPDWFRGLRDQCSDAGVPIFFKQWGEWAPVEISEYDDGQLGPAYPTKGCSLPSGHRGDQDCLFWQNDKLVPWPKITPKKAIGARRIGKKAAGRSLDGVIHNAYPILSGWAMGCRTQMAG